MGILIRKNEAAIRLAYVRIERWSALYKQVGRCWIVWHPDSFPWKPRILLVSQQQISSWFCCIYWPSRGVLFGLFLILWLLNHQRSPLLLAYSRFETHQIHPTLHKLWAGVVSSEALAVIVLCCYSSLLLILRCRAWFVLSSCWFGSVVTFQRNSRISDCRCCLSSSRLHLLSFWGRLHGPMGATA